LVVSAAQPLFEGQEAREAETVLASSPEAVQSRESSQLAYSGLTGVQAGLVAGEAFPALVDHAAGGVPVLSAGQSVIGFADSRAVQVEGPGGAHGIVESSAPVATRTEAGSWMPVDLSVSETSSGFAVRNPVVAVGIPQNLSVGVSLADSGVSLAPSNDAGQSEGGQPGSVKGAVVFYPSLGVGLDVDGVVKPTPTGFAEDLILRSDRVCWWTPLNSARYC
jgi:hypothetical protein